MALGEFYVAYSGEHLDSAQGSDLCLPIAGVNVASIGQADDVALLSHDITFLRNLLELGTNFCAKYHVILVPEKTKLLGIFEPRHRKIVDYYKSENPIFINNKQIKFS